MSSRAFRVGYFGIAGEASRGEGWLGSDAAWWSAALPSTSQLFPRGSAADSGYWALRCHKNQRFLAWVRNTVTSARLHTTIACAHLDEDGLAGFVVPLARFLQESTQEELTSNREVASVESPVSLRSGWLWFLTLHSGAHMKPAGSVRHMLASASCRDPLELVAAAAIHQEYESRDANIAVLSVYPERPERGDFVASGWNAILVPSAAITKVPQALSLPEISPFSDSIRRRSASELSNDVLAVMSKWRARASCSVWQERLDIPLEWLRAHEMTAEEWERRKITIRSEVGDVGLERDLQHLRDNRHDERILDLAAIESVCGKRALAMLYLAETKLGVSRDDLDEVMRLGIREP